MKPVGILNKWLACVMAVGALTTVASLNAAEDRALVRAVRGTADFSVREGVWNSLRVGMPLRQGVTIRTASDGEVDLFMRNNGPVVRVTSGTTLTLNSLFFNNSGAEIVIDTKLDLKNGRILGKVNRMAAASVYEVKTPFGVAGIRGTEYDISARGRVRIKSGSCVFDTGDSTNTIGAGQQFDASAPNPSVSTFDPSATPAVDPGPDGPTPETVEGPSLNDVFSELTEVETAAPPATVEGVTPPAPTIKEETQQQVDDTNNSAFESEEEDEPVNEDENRSQQAINNAQGAITAALAILNNIDNQTIAAQAQRSLIKTALNQLTKIEAFAEQNGTDVDQILADILAEAGLDQSFTIDDILNNSYDAR